MSTFVRFYPSRIGDQILWLTNWTGKIGGYQATLGYAAGDISATVADALRLIYLLQTVQNEAQNFAFAITSHITLMQNGSGSSLVTLPAFTLPTTPTPPANVLPGALKRILAFVANLKTRVGYNDGIGADLQILSSTVADNPGAVPDASVTANSGEVALTFKKLGHPGVYIEEQTGAGTVWNFLAICTNSPYHDVRPLAVAGVPEKRRYRLCFWDNVPSHVWTATFEVTYGG